MRILVILLFAGWLSRKEGTIPDSSYCHPKIDSFRAEIPWFPLNNVSAPPKLTVSELINQINDTATARGWTIQSNMISILDLHCARAYSFCSRGESDSLEYVEWRALNLEQMVQRINNCEAHLACGAITHFSNSFLNTHYPEIYATNLNFGGNELSHTVSLWQVDNVILYYDALNGLTLSKTNGDTIDFRRAYLFVLNGQYDSVKIRLLPQHFGPDWALLDPEMVYKMCLNKTYTSFKQVWDSYNFSYPLDSSWFCTMDSVELMGFYWGNTFNRWFNSSERPASGQNILNYIESYGYDRKLFNWWRISPTTTNQSVHLFIDSINAASR